MSLIRINKVTKEDFYNSLYWDHRIYDTRSLEDYNRSHICRAHHIDCSSIETISIEDKQIDDDYGKAENPSKVLVYNNNDNSLEMDLLISYLKSSKNASNKYLKEIEILLSGFESFNSKFPYLCSDHIYFNECCQLSWPSCITPSIYLGSSMCRNEMIISLLNITHIISLSDYPEKKLELSSIKTIHYEVEDSLSSNMFPIFDSSISWISKCLNDDKGILLIHCEQGVSRSAIILMGYLLYSNENFLSVNEVYQFVKSKRNIIKPNESFLKQLEEYLIKIRLNKC
jgi:protein-tyrosine phosphatase